MITKLQCISVITVIHIHINSGKTWINLSFTAPIYKIHVCVFGLYTWSLWKMNSPTVLNDQFYLCIDIYRVFLGWPAKKEVDINIFLITFIWELWHGRVINGKISLTSTQIKHYLRYNVNESNSFMKCQTICDALHSSNSLYIINIY